MGAHIRPANLQGRRPGSSSDQAEGLSRSNSQPRLPQRQAAAVGEFNADGDLSSSLMDMFLGGSYKSLFPNVGSGTPMEDVKGAPFLAKHAAVRTYTVVSGDTLSGIAQKELGSGARYQEIAAANGIKNPNLISPGQVLIIPNGGGPAQKPAGNQVMAPVAATDEYVVQSGDTLWAISQRVLGDGNRYQEIASLNGLRDPNHIFPGQRLRLPKTQNAQAPVKPEDPIEDHWICEQLTNDWAGCDILSRYLAGTGGDWDLDDVASWSDYMKASGSLTLQVREQLEQLAEQLVQGGSQGAVSVDRTFHAEIENGEDAVGYQYLHGTNGAVGDFQIKGAADVQRRKTSTQVNFDVEFTWHDIIDPNKKYITDRAKDLFARIITLNRVKAYRIHIRWSGQPIVKVTNDPIDATEVFGDWPGDGTSK